MDDNRIELVARVDVDESADQIIKHDLKPLQDKINAVDGLKINCSIDTKNFDVLRKQISEFSKGLKIDVNGLNISSNKFGLDIEPTREEIRQLEKDLDLVFDKRKTGKYANQLRQEFTSLIDDYKDSFSKALDSGEFTETNNAYQKLIDFVIKYRREIDTTNEALVEQKKLIKSITASTLADGQKATTYIDSRLKAELDSMTGGIAGDNKKILDNVFGVGGWTYDRSKSFNTFDSVAEELRSIPSLQNLDSNYIEAFRQVIGLLNGSLSETNDMIELIERETESELYTTLGNFLNNILLPIVEAHNNLTESKDTPEFVSEDTIKNLDTVENKLETIVATEKEAQELMNTKADVNMEYPSLLSSKNTKETLENAKRQLNELEIPATRITRAIEDSTGQLIAFDVQVEKEDKSIEKLRYRLNEAGDGFEYLYKTIREADNATDLRKKPIEVSVGIKTSELDTFIKKVEDSGVPIEKFTYSVDDLKKSLSDVGNVDIGFDAGKFNAFQDKFAIAKAEFKGLQNEMRIASKDQTFENRLKKITAQVQSFEQANNKATTSLKQMSDGRTFAQGWEDLKKALSSADLNADGLKHINEQLATFKAEANSAGLTSSAFFKNMGEQIKGVVTQYVSLYAAMNAIRGAIDNVITLDSAMVNLKKVTDETDLTYENFLNDADQQAKELRSSMADVVEQTSEWAKLGYNLDEARELARTSQIYAVVGEVDNATAVGDLVSSLKAFNIEAEDSITLVDRFNKLGNEFATDAKSIGEGLRVSASALASTGNDIDETLALLVGGTEITQNATETANAIRTISLRLQGMKGKLEELNEEADGIESISKIQTQILNLTDNQVNIFDDNGKFKSTYEILKEVSAIYKDLSDSRRASLFEIMFGKNRMNQGVAVLQAFDSGQIEKAYEASVNSANSAQQEFDKAMESIESHLTSLKEAWEKLSNSVIKSDLIIKVIDGGTAILELLDKIANSVYTLPTILGVISGIVTKFFISGEILSSIKAITSAVSVLFATIKAGETALVGGLVIGAVVAGISGLIAVMQKAKKEADKLAQQQTEEAKKRTQAYKEEANDFEAVLDQYAELATRTEELNGDKERFEELQRTLHKLFGDEADDIDLVNGKYSEQIEKLRELRKEQTETYLVANQDEYRNQIKFLNFGDKEIADSAEKITNALSYKQNGNKQWESNILNGLTGNAKQQLQSLNALIEDGLINAETEFGKSLIKTRDELQANINLAKEFINDYNQIGEQQKDLDVPADVQQQLDETIDKIQDTAKKISQLGNPEDMTKLFVKQQELSDLKEEAYELAKGSAFYTQRLDEIFDEIEKDAANVDSAIESNIENFTKLRASMEDTQKGVDKISSAMQKLANGEKLSSKEAWDIFDLDTEGILTDIRMINGEYQLSIDQLIKLKDSYVNTMSETIESNIRDLQTQIKNINIQIGKTAVELKKNITLQSQSSHGFEGFKERLALVKQADELKQKYQDANLALSKQSLYLEQIKTQLGNTINLAEAAVKATEKEIKNVDSQIKGLKSQLDEENRKLKEQLKPIEDNIKALEKQKDVTSESKEELQEQLEILEEQADNLNKTLDNYKNVASLVKDEIEKENDLIKEQQDAIKNQYDEQIQALKDVREQKEEENALTEKEIKMQEKLKALEDARNQKVKTYSSERGWYFDVDREAVVKAENEYADARKDYEDLKEKQDFDAQIEALEDERDNLIKQYDIQIEAGQKYLKQWEEILDAEEKADSERLAGQILGAEWREKILSKDTELIVEFGTEYSNYSKKLKQLTDVEIANLKKSIKAKEDEVKAIEKQIKAQKDLKTSYEDAAKSVTASIQSQIDALENYKNDLNAKLTESKEVLANYQNAVNPILEQLSSKLGDLNRDSNSAFDGINGHLWWSLYGDGGFMDMMNDMKKAASEARLEMIELQLAKLDAGAVDHSSRFSSFMRDILGFSTGGTADFTGLAMLHGSQSQAETIFNASQSKALYNMVASGQFSDMVANKAVSGINSALSKTSTNNNSSMVINIDKVVTDNPQNFTQQLDKYMSDYWTKKLTMSYTR